MAGGPRPSVSLFVLRARAAPVAAVLRRGPSKEVALVRWDTRSDRFEVGQWLKGRVDEHRCDLAPNGELLVYFAKNWARPYATWTAISRPPYFTAITLWPKGDSYGGGGLFDSDTSLRIDHRGNQLAIAEGFSLPPRMKVAPCGEHPPAYLPLFEERLRRDGWRPLQPDAARIRLPIAYGRELRRKNRRPLELRVTLRRRREGAGRAFFLDYVLVDHATGAEEPMGADWADWDERGDLLFARGGRLYRHAIDSRKRGDLDLAGARELVDLAPLRFSEKPPPKRPAPRP